MIAAVAASPQARLDSLPLLAEETLQRLSLGHNDTAADYPREACVHQLFEEQAQRAPDQIAAVCGGLRMTFRELDRRANRLAHHL
ncbi:MAG TPA: hypothetical protein DD490_06450, partial [Acidobacteria bacterium]|nr:hypothetical protein [Acidobacteriota bacterium]